MSKLSIEQYTKSKLRIFVNEIKSDLVSFIILNCVFLLLILILFGKFLAPFDANEIVTDQALLPPSWSILGNLTHFLGTDQFGRDLFSRLLTGFYYNLGAPLIITLLIVVLGTVVGIYSALKSHNYIKIHSALNIFYNTPSLLLAIVIALIFKPSFTMAMLAIFLAIFPYFTNQIYEYTKRLLQKNWVKLLRIEGASDYFMIKKVIFPNMIVVLFKEGSYIFTLAILDLSALGFIGLTGNSNFAEWGSMMRLAMPYLDTHPFLAILPGAFLVVSIIMVRLFGDLAAKKLQQLEETLWHF